MKAKKIAKRLRARARELRQMDGFQILTDRGYLLADILQKVAEQISPRSKKAKKAKKVAAKIITAAKEAATNGAKPRGHTTPASTDNR